MIKHMTRHKRRIIFAVSILAFLIVALAALGYSQGYILDKNFQFSKRGGLYISAPLSGSKIYINNKEKKETGVFNSGLFLSNLKVGEYSVLVAKEDFWPWAKTLKVEKGLVTETRAFMVPENPKGEILLKGKFFSMWASDKHEFLVLEGRRNDHFYLIFYFPEEQTYLNADSKFTENLLTSEDNISELVFFDDHFVFKGSKGPVRVNFNFSRNTVSASYFNEYFDSSLSYERLDKRKVQKIWWNPDLNEIYVDWLKESSEVPYYICEEKNCALPIQIFKSHLAIKNIDFFPRRKDVIIMAVANGVYALEIDGRGGRLLHPIYKGKDPMFAIPKGSGDVYITDGVSLIRIYLK